MNNPKTDLALLCQCQVLVVDMELDFALEPLTGDGGDFLWIPNQQAYRPDPVSSLSKKCSLQDGVDYH